MSENSRPATRTRNLRDRLERGWYLQRLSWALQDYPGGARKQILTELRGEIDAAADDVGTTRALEDLGRPALLAGRYLTELDRPLPRWNTGGVAAVLAVTALVYLGFAYAVGTLDTLLALGGGTRTAYPLGGRVVFTATDDELWVEGLITWQALLLHVGVGLVAFALGSRVWRALPSRSRQA